VTRRTFHRSGYTPCDSTRWPRRRPGRAPSSSPQPRKRPGGPPRRTRRQWRARSSPGGMSPRRRYRRAGTEMQQCNLQCGCSWGRCLSPFAGNLKQRDMFRSDRRIAVWRRVEWPGSSVRRRPYGPVEWLVSGNAVFRPKSLFMAAVLNFCVIATANCSLLNRSGRSGKPAPGAVGGLGIGRF
jgi:hypothetical protein